MGHADTSMIHKRYTKYIKNLTRKDGSLFEKFYSENVSKKDEKDDKGTIKKNEATYNTQNVDNKRSMVGGGGGSRTRVRKYSPMASTYIVRILVVAA